jgi:apolipoprotein D and lipocalin family protein
MRALACPALRALAGLALLAVAACAGRGPEPPAVASGVDLERYLGTWYEIASFPTRFQRGCSHTRAHYARREDGRIAVRNECFRDGAWDDAVGSAWQPGSDPARLRVRYFWPFSAPYWILALGPDYRWALVGTPDRRFLWVLARRPALDEDAWQTALGEARARGFDPERLVRTVQSEPAPPR